MPILKRSSAISVALGQGCQAARAARPGDTARRRRGRRGVVAIEFAIVAIPLFTFILFIFEMSYDLFVQEALDAGLHKAVRKLQTGNAQNVADGGTFVSSYLCPSLRGLLECGSHVFVKVQKFSFSAIDQTDNFYSPKVNGPGATGKIPVSGSTLNLAGFGSTDFCNSGPGQVTLVTAIYVGPTFVGGLLPGLFSVTYGGALVHATMSTTGLVTEDYVAATPQSGATPPAKGC